MSPRIIHFGSRQLSWECNELCACETFPDGLPEALQYAGGKQELLRLVQATTSLKAELPKSTPSPQAGPDSSEHEMQQFRIWHNVLQNYLARELTFESDRLPALSGIAKHLESVLGGIYLAGIWNNDSVIFQLAWYCTSELRPRQQSKEKLPTWSWASVETKISVINPETSEKGYSVPWIRKGSKVVDARVNLLGGDTFGGIDGGFLLVEGPLNCITMRSGKGYLGKLDLTLEVRLDVSFDVPQDLYILLLYKYGEVDYSVDREYGDIRDRYVYLTLTPSPKRPGSYERVGIAIAAYMEEEHWGKESPPSSPPMDVQNGYDAACEAFLGKEKGHRFYIF